MRALFIASLQLQKKQRETLSNEKNAIIFATLKLKTRDRKVFLAKVSTSDAKKVAAFP